MNDKIDQKKMGKLLRNDELFVELNEPQKLLTTTSKFDLCINSRSTFLNQNKNVWLYCFDDLNYWKN